MRKIAMFLALCLILGVLAGCGGKNTVSEQTYTLRCGVQLTAGAGLTETNYSGAAGALEEDRYAIMFTQVAASRDMNQSEFVAYIEGVMDGEGFNAKRTSDDRGVPAYTYIRDVDGTDFVFYLTLHQNEEGWWLCEMSCRASMRALYEERFERWSATVVLPGESTVSGNDGVSGNSDNNSDNSGNSQDSGGSGQVSVDPGRTKRFELDNGATFIGPDDLEVYSIGERDYAMENQELIMLLVEENKQAYGLEGMTLEEYGEYLMENSGLFHKYGKDSLGNLAAGYTTELDGEAYYCYGIVRETGTSFWYFDIYCLAELRDGYETAMMQWCDSLTLEETEMFSREDTKVYKLENGASITAMDGLTEDNDGLDQDSAYLYGSGLHIGVFWMDRSEYGLENTTAGDLAEQMEEGGDSGTFFVNRYGCYASEYYDESDGNTYYNYMTIVEEKDGFWLCMMYCLASNEAVYGDHMAQWAASVSSIE